MNRLVLPKYRLVAFASLAMLGCAGALSPAPTAHAAGPAHTPRPTAAPRPAADWTKTVVATLDGGVRVGNPMARLKLVEYGSLTCDHCATFATQSRAGLYGRYIASGRVSFEFRSYARNAIDLAGTLALRCLAPARSLAEAEHILTSQADWLLPLPKILETRQAELNALPPAQRLQKLAELSGFSARLRAAGFSPDRVNACLADPAGMRSAEAVVTQANNRYQLDGTPLFLLNNRVLTNVRDWAGVEAALKQAGA